MATLRLTTPDGEIAIHSVYNIHQPGKEIDIELLAARTTLGERNIVMGDFNLHNLLWSGPLLFNPTRDLPAARLLEHEMITKGNMALLTKQGTITCTRGKGDNHPTASCIDLTFVSDSLLSKVSHWGVFADNPWDKSDHRLIRTILDVTPYRDETEKFQHNKVKSAAFAADIKDNIWRVLAMPLNTKDDVEEFVAAIGALVLGASIRTTPTCLVNPPPARKLTCEFAIDRLLGQGLTDL